MNKDSLKAKRLADTTGAAASMTVFLIFAICSLAIISIAAGTYSRITGNYDDTFNSSAAARYITNKIRSSESCEIISDGHGIAVHSGGIVSVIYCSGGELYEKAVSENSEDTEPSGGSIIFGADKLDISDSEDGIYRITVSSGDDSFSAVCRR